MISKISYNKKKLKNEELIHLYKALLCPRLIEEKMLLLLRQGRISKWFSGIGQEAISVGCTEALEKDELIFPLHRNLGVFTSRRMPLDRLFAQWQGKLILHEGNPFAGIGAEISAWINEHCFQYLDAPVIHCASLDTPTPFVKRLEDQYLAYSVLEEKLRYLQSY